MRCKEPLQLDTVEELEMHKKLRASAALILTFCRCRFVFRLVAFFDQWKLLGYFHDIGNNIDAETPICIIYIYVHK